MSEIKWISEDELRRRATESFRQARERAGVSEWQLLDMNTHFMSVPGGRIYRYREFLVFAPDAELL